MMIVDAIRSAGTQHAVYFLVTAYIESLRHFEGSCGVPRDALELPLAGREDLEERVRKLHQDATATELAAVLACSLERLAALDDAAPVAAVMPHARNDTRRSSLSV